MLRDFQTFAAVEMWGKVNFVDDCNTMVVMELEVVAVNKNLEFAIDYLLADEMGSRLALVVPVGYKHQDNCAHSSPAQSTANPSLLAQRLGGHHHQLS